MFTKERVEKKISSIKRPTSIALEPSILVLNVPKGNLKNLGTVTEDEEKDVKTVISETASSINKFCEDKRNEDLKTEPNTVRFMERNPFSKTDLALNVDISVKSSEDIKSDVMNSDKVVTKEEKSEKPDSSDKKKLNFDELRRRPDDENRRMPENKPFLRDRSASIGTIALKTPIAQVIEQNRTMLFQVSTHCYHQKGVVVHYMEPYPRGNTLSS